MKKEFVSIEIDLGIKELEEKLQQINKAQEDLYRLIYEAEEIATKNNIKISFKREA